MASQVYKVAKGKQFWGQSRQTKNSSLLSDKPLFTAPRVAVSKLVQNVKQNQNIHREHSLRTFYEQTTFDRVKRRREQFLRLRILAELLRL